MKIRILIVVCLLTCVVCNAQVLETGTDTIALQLKPDNFCLRNVYYDFGSKRWMKGDQDFIDTITVYLKSHKDCVIEVCAYSDGKETRKFGVLLSQQRAQLLSNYLEAHGVDRSRMVLKGLGGKNRAAAEEIGKRDNPEGRQLNRRVELKIYSESSIPRRVIYNSGNHNIFANPDHIHNNPAEEDDTTGAKVVH